MCVCVCVCGVGADIHHHGSGVYDFSRSFVLRAPSENRYWGKFKGKAHRPQVNLSQHTNRFGPFSSVCVLLQLSIMAMSCVRSSEGEELSAQRHWIQRKRRIWLWVKTQTVFNSLRQACPFKTYLIGSLWKLYLLVIVLLYASSYVCILMGLYIYIYIYIYIYNFYFLSEILQYHEYYSHFLCISYLN